MQANRIITLTSDFGYQDPYVGIMKGVILSANKQLQMIDINHGIDPQNIYQAALVMKASVFAFPHGTTHLVVVDPGVGSGCRRLCARSQSYYYVFPDNGVMDLVFCEDPPLETAEVRVPDEHPVSATFHGRDIFAPCAAALASGRSLSEIGEDLLSPSATFKSTCYPARR